MRHAEWVQLVAVCYFVALAFMRALPWNRRLKIVVLAGLSVIGVFALRWSALIVGQNASSVIRDWVPGALLLIPFYQTGLLFVRPDEELQGRLSAFDERILSWLGLSPEVIARIPGLQLYLELAYLLVYPMIPFGIGCLYLTGRRCAVDDFWTVVLTATFLCYAVTPFVPALPPRTLGTSLFPAPRTPIRGLNVWLLRHTSIQVVTFPSGHVACATAIALSLLRLEPWIGCAFVVLAISIAAATVVGGYHYVSDALTAIVIALLTFSASYLLLIAALML